MLGVSLASPRNTVSLPKVLPKRFTIFIVFSGKRKREAVTAASLCVAFTLIRREC